MSKPLTPEIFEECASFVEAVMGDHLRKNLASYERAKQSGNTEFVPHRLAFLYERMVEARITTKQNPPSGDLAALTELIVFKELVKEFELEDGWSEIKSELNATRSFVHLISMLLFLKMQRGRKTKCGFMPSNSTAGNSPDIVMYTPAKDKIHVEVKAPEILIMPTLITEEQARKVIKKCWKKARKQLANEASILLIGGLFIPNKTLDRLEQAAKEFFAKKSNRNVAFIQILSLTLVLENPIITGQKVGIGKGTSYKPQITYRQAQNTHYENIVEFHLTEKLPEGFDKSSPDQREVTIKGDEII